MVVENLGLLPTGGREGGRQARGSDEEGGRTGRQARGSDEEGGRAGTAGEEEVGRRWREAEARRST